MGKRVVFAVLCLSFFALALFGCGQGQTLSPTTSALPEIPDCCA